MRRPADPLLGLVAGATLANGLLGVLHSVFARVPDAPGALFALLPVGVHHWSKHLTLASGFLLIDLSYHLWKRRRAAWWMAMLVFTVAAAAHLGKGHHPALAIAPAANAMLLFALRRRFTVRSEPYSVARGLGLVAASLLIVLVYGAAGFWQLDARDFGINFTWRDALSRSMREYSLQGNPDLVPRTRHARWFLDSMDVAGVVAVGFALFSIYRPLAYRLRTQPHERAQAKLLLDGHGMSSLDYFKLWPDKSYFFGAQSRGVIAYRAAWGVAVALGDPVGAPADVDTTLRAFLEYCANNGWRAAFHQALPGFLPLYESLGLNALKVGEEALVDLQHFTAKTVGSSGFRRVRNRSTSLGLHVTRHEAPVDAAVLDEAAAVSNEWLDLPGRRERSFTLGRFERDYVRDTELHVARDKDGRALAFVNIIPCWPPGDTTFDLMRHRADVPNGTMDFLFMELFASLAARFRRCSMGLAPLAGVGDRPGAPMEERAVHQIYERLNRFFSYKGLHNYKNKFEPVWEDRFLVYQGGPPGLVATTLALTRIAEN